MRWGNFICFLQPVIYVSLGWHQTKVPLQNCFFVIHCNHFFILLLRVNAGFYLVLLYVNFMQFCHKLRFSFYPFFFICVFILFSRQIVFFFYPETLMSSLIYSTPMFSFYNQNPILCIFAPTSMLDFFYNPLHCFN